MFRVLSPDSQESPDSQIEPDTGEIFQHQFYHGIAIHFFEFFICRHLRLERENR